MKKELFENIIGYDDIKRTLKNIVDSLNNKEKYEKIGCRISNGLLIYGPPGTGKTSIAKDILEHTNRKSFIIRKDKSDGSFINYLKKIFEAAKKEQPSIILLDDLDKFSEGDDSKYNNEEYVVVQSLMDDIKNKDIFVIATANDIYDLPNSLKRKGRFDFQFEIAKPKEEDMIKIFTHYLNSKKIDKEVDINKICCILNDSSCAELEEVSNMAGFYAAYKNKKKIGMEELIRASLEMKYETNIEDYSLDDDYIINTAYHEAGHALIGELLEPGSIAFITATKNDGSINGITKYHENKNYHDDIKYRINRIKSLLAGKAAIEIVFNTCDAGASSDIKRAYSIVDDLIDDYCMKDFKCHPAKYNEPSEFTKETNDIEVQRTITDYYNEVKTMLINNRTILDKLALELKEKKLLFPDEIKKIIYENN